MSGAEGGLCHSLSLCPSHSVLLPLPASSSPHITPGSGVWAKHPGRVTAQAQGYN